MLFVLAVLLDVLSLARKAHEDAGEPHLHTHVRHVFVCAIWGFWLWFVGFMFCGLVT